MARTKVVSHSELDAYRQCRLKHQMAWKEFWLPPPDQRGEALARGSLFHEVMEFHYKKRMAGMTSAGIAQELQTTGLLFDTETAKSSERQDLVAWMYEGYVEHYGDDEDWEILGVEQEFNAMLPTRRGTTSSFRFTGKIDLVLRDRSMGGGLWIVDHKTGGDLPKQRDLDLEDQMALYIYLMRRKGMDVRGCIYNAVRTKKLVRPMVASERFLRKPMARTDYELEEVAREAYDLFKEAHKKRPKGQDAPRSPNAQTCSWRCPYTEPCLGSRKGGDRIEMLADMGFVVDLETDRGSRNPAKEGAKSEIGV